MENDKTTKLCNTCNNQKDLSEFYCRDGKYYGGSCKECLREKQKSYKKSPYSKKYQRKHHLKKKYNISEKEYDQLYKEQAGKCSICGVPESELKRALSVDHDHKTGKIRGLLCGMCNHGLGNFKDNISNLENAMFYLILHK